MTGLTKPATTGITHGSELLSTFLNESMLKQAGDVRGWGAGEAGFNAAMTEMNANGGGVLYVNEDIMFTAIPIMHLPLVTVYWNNSKAIVQTGSVGTYGYLMNGGGDQPVYNNAHHFTLANKTNCYGLQLIAQDYTIGIDAIGVRVEHCYGYTYEGGAIIGFNKGGWEDEFCYEGKVSKFTPVVANTRDDQSIGLHMRCTDSWYSEIAPVGYAYGGKCIKSGNSLSKFHPWGNTIDNLVGVMGKMHVGLWVTENGGFTSYSDLILDTPVRRNVNNPPSRTNGGVGVINDAWDTSFDGILVLPSRNDVLVPKSTLPMITTSQRSSYRNLSVSNENFVTSTWVSFEGTSGYCKNEFTGYGYAERMRTGMNISASSGASLAGSAGITIGSQTLSSGINFGNMKFSITTTLSGVGTTADVVMNLAPLYGINAGLGTLARGGLFFFSLATANAGGNKLVSVTVEAVGNNQAKFMLYFENGATRYGRWSDVSNSASPKSIELVGVIHVA